MHLPLWTGASMSLYAPTVLQCRRDSAGRRGLCSSYPGIAHSSAHPYCQHSCGSDLRDQWPDTAQDRSNNSALFPLQLQAETERQPPLHLHLMYAFSRRFYPKQLSVFQLTFFLISMRVPWELNPQPFALLTQCSTTEPQVPIKTVKHLPGVALVNIVHGNKCLKIWGGKGTELRRCGLAFIRISSKISAGAISGHVHEREMESGNKMMEELELWWV